MTITDADIREIQAKLAPMLGEKAWGISLGVGSFITLEFGAHRLAEKQNERTHGEWHLWIYHSAWRLEEIDKVLASSEDDRSKIEVAIQRLEGLKLRSVDVVRPIWDTVFNFEEQVVLRLFSTFSENVEYWMLYTPDGNVISLGPGTGWSYESSAIA